MNQWDEFVQEKHTLLREDGSSFIDAAKQYDWLI